MLRSARERIAQTAAFEVSGLVVSLPLMALASPQSHSQNASVLAVLAVAVLAWTPIYNAAFDQIEWRRTARVASDRPQLWRIVHAVLHEVSALLVTLPLLMWLAGLELRTALAVDLGLSAIYAGWAWLFYLAWDHLRPITPVSTPPNTPHTLTKLEQT